MVVPAATAKEVLQWSHGILAMDRGVDEKQWYAIFYASMEPWHFSHG